MTLGHIESFLSFRRRRRLLHLGVFLPLAVLTATQVSVPSTAPSVVSSRGYINRSPQITHTTAAFNSGTATTLLAFVSSHPFWNGQMVSIGGLADNVGNSWTPLIGPTTWVGGSYPLVSAIYYVNAPVTNSKHRLTLNLTNPAPVVMHVFAVSGSDITSPPIHSDITSPATGRASADVRTFPIPVSTDTLMLSWVKNESYAKTAALDDYNLDTQSTSYLWAASRSSPASGWFTGHFKYATPVGWQTAVVGLKPAVLTPELDANAPAFAMIP